MSDPDLSTLSKRARYAANVIDEINDDPTADGGVTMSGRRAAWNGADLRSFAASRGADERLTEQLAREIYEAWGDTTTALSWADCLFPEPYFDHARKLIESGWRKND